MAEIFVADIPDGIEMVQSAVGDRHTVTTAQTFDKAMDNLTRRRFDLVVIGVHFDDSRMYELISNMRNFTHNRSTPLAAFRCLQTDLSDFFSHSIELGCKALRACKFIDMVKLTSDGGKPELILLREIEDCLPHGKRTAK
jgi:hypothetical protein